MNLIASKFGLAGNKSHYCLSSCSVASWHGSLATVKKDLLLIDSLTGMWMEFLIAYHVCISKETSSVARATVHYDSTGQRTAQQLYEDKHKHTLIIIRPWHVSLFLLTFFFHYGLCLFASILRTCPHIIFPYVEIKYIIYCLNTHTDHQFICTP